MEFKADFDVYMKPKQFYEANTPKLMHYYGSNAHKVYKEKSKPTKTSNPPSKVNRLTY
jgi:hypothetical protein